MTKKTIFKNALISLIKEELKHYDTKQFKNIKKQSPKPVKTAERGTVSKVDDKDTEFLNELVRFVEQYNTKQMCDLDDDALLNELSTLAKIIGVKKSVVKENIKNYKRRPRIYAFEVAEFFIDKNTPEDEVTKKELKKNDPERPKEVKDKERKEGKEEKKTEKANVSSKVEKAPAKPKGVKEMPTKAKTAKGIKLMESEPNTLNKQFYLFDKSNNKLVASGDFKNMHRRSEKYPNHILGTLTYIKTNYPKLAAQLEMSKDSQPSKLDI